MTKLTLTKIPANGAGNGTKIWRRSRPNTRGLE